MFSSEKCLTRSGSASPANISKIGVSVTKGGVVSDEVASAVAAVSDEIGDILKDELDADRAERIGADLADLSAELGLLAGLAEGEQQPDFPSLYDIAMGHRGSASLSSSSSGWSGTRNGRARRPLRPPRAYRRRTIGKGKEMSWRRNTLARRNVDVRRVEVVSDASDVGADTDSDDQWTELDEACSSESSSVKESATVNKVDCSYPEKEQEAQAPPMGQFLLPLLSAETNAPNPSEHFLIKHEDILQLLASADETARSEIPDTPDEPMETNTTRIELPPVSLEPAPVSPEEEARVLHYVCEAERLITERERPTFRAIEDKLLYFFHTWCETSSLLHTTIGTTMSLIMYTNEWLYRGHFDCHCRLCMCLVYSSEALSHLLHRTLLALAKGEKTLRDAVVLMRALELREPTAELEPNNWDLTSGLPFSDEGEVVVHQQLEELSTESDLTKEIVEQVCVCSPLETPPDSAPHEVSMECFYKILKQFKTASTITYKVNLFRADGEIDPQLEAASRRLTQYLAPYQNFSTRMCLAELAGVADEMCQIPVFPPRCDCLAPKTLCAKQRKVLLRLSFFGFMKFLEEYRALGNKYSYLPLPIENWFIGTNELQQGDGTGAKPPDSRHELAGADVVSKEVDKVENSPGDGEEESDVGSGTASLGLSTSSSLDSASELLLAAAAAVESASEAETAPGELCRTVRHLMRSIASIERLMDRVLKHCDSWPIQDGDGENRKHVDISLSEVDRKLMAMYRRLPEVHRKQLQVYRKQKKLSTVCMQLVGGQAPAPPPPGSPPPASPPHTASRALCPEYHLQRFKEVRRKVMHMRDQQLYYHRLRMWLEDQLRQDRDRAPEAQDSIPAPEDTFRQNVRRTNSPKHPRLATAAKRKLRPNVATCIAKPHKILQMLKYKAPPHSAYLLTDSVKARKLEAKPDEKKEVGPPEAFTYTENVPETLSDADTIVGERENDICKEMKECLARFANFALNNPDTNLNNEPSSQETAQVDPEVKQETYPDSISPPLQELSPTEPLPAYSKSKILTVNKLINQPNVLDKIKEDFRPETTSITPDALNIELANPRRTEEVADKDNVEEVKTDKEKTDPLKMSDLYKYMLSGIEIKKAMEDCLNIINTYNSGSRTEDNKANEIKAIEEKEVAECEEKNDIGLVELVENFPQIIANLPDVASKLPEVVSIMNSLPEVNSEAQLTPETLKQIRELKFNKKWDNVKVTKNTTKRKSNRRIRNNVDSDVIGTMTFEFNSKEITDLLKDEKELLTLMENKSTSDYKDLLLAISAQFVTNFEISKDKKIFDVPNNVNVESCSKPSNLFDNSVKSANSMDELRELVRYRFNTCKQYFLNKFKTVPLEGLQGEIETMSERFYSYIQELADKQNQLDNDKIVEKVDEITSTKCQKDGLQEVSNFNLDKIPGNSETIKQINKLIGTSTTNTFDTILMKVSKLSDEKRKSMENLQFKYTDILKRCAESPELIGWIMVDPEISANVILEMSGLGPKQSPEATIDFSVFNNERKRDYFLERLSDMNKMYMTSLPKDKLTGDEWLVMLYRLEQLENQVKTSFNKYISIATKPAQTQTQNVSETHEAELLAGKGLSKLINKANSKIPKKPNSNPPKEHIIRPMARAELKMIEPIKEPVKEEPDYKIQNDALLAKCEAFLTSKGEKSLLDSFYMIKSYITQGLPVPESYKKHVLSICSSIDAKLLYEDIEDSLKDESSEETEIPKEEIDKILIELDKHKKKIKHEEKPDVKIPNCCQPDYSDSGSNSPTCCPHDPKTGKHFAIIGSQNPELLAKYSAQALRNAKQTLNAVAFNNIKRNGQTKSESDACDTNAPKNDCKWTNDCLCISCCNSDGASSICLGDIVKQCYDMEAKQGKNVLDDQKPKVPVKESKAVPTAKVPPVKAQPKPAPPKVCENINHQTHVCKVGHSSGVCANEGGHHQNASAGPDQPCTCCYCTVFGHAPQLTPVPRNFNETRERLRSILNKKKQKCKATVTAEQECQDKKNVQVAVQTQAENPQQVAQKQKQPVTNTPKMAPAKTAPAGANGTSNLVKSQEPAANQNFLAERMAKMILADGQEAQKEKPQIPPQQVKMLQRTQPVQVDVPPVAPEAKAMTPEQHLHLQQQIRQHCEGRTIPGWNGQQPHPMQATKPQQQPMQQQRPSRPQQQRQQLAVSLSSRDTSVFSTSSGCSGVSGWRDGCMSDGERIEDTRDLDALLQYIEGPSRHVDRGKKRAKKQRQKAKKMESKLLEERRDLLTAISEQRREIVELRAKHTDAKRQVEEMRAQLKQAQVGKKKGKKNKTDPAQQAKLQMVAERLGELTNWQAITAMDIRDAEAEVTICMERLQQCEAELREAKSTKGANDEVPQQKHNLEQHKEKIQLEQQCHRLQILELEKQKLERQMMKRMENNYPGQNLVMANPLVRVRRQPGDGAVTISLPGQAEEQPLVQLMQNKQLNVLGMCEDYQQPKPEPQKKQTWEAALAHINQLAKQPAPKKEKIQKKPKEVPEKEPPKQLKKESRRSQSLTDVQPISKKQQKMIKKQAEEEETKRKQLEAKKKTELSKKSETIKTETVKKNETKKVEVLKKTETIKKPKEDKKEVKKPEKVSEKFRVNENKHEPNVATPSSKQKQLPNQTAAPKTVKKKTAEKPQVINITPETTIEIVSKKGTCSAEAEKPASCSIMEQLSCGVQVPCVADLKLPPGITLTRVQPNEKKEQPVIKSVPLWKANQLPSTPTPLPRPAPVINVDPSMMMYSTAQPEPSKSVLLPEPVHQPGKSKKAKKKAKKAAAAVETHQGTPQQLDSKKTDGTKMVTLRNPMFHPNLPPVQLASTPPQKVPDSIRIPDPIPMPPNACQATITPTSNGMYTIRNPLMSMMHQQGLMGMRAPSPQMNPILMSQTPQYRPAYVNPNTYNPTIQNPNPAPYVLDPPRASPKTEPKFIEERQPELQTETPNYNSRINLASFTQKNDDGYSLFKPSEENQVPRFLNSDTYGYDNQNPFVSQSPKPVVSPNPIGTRPNPVTESSLFTNPPMPEPIGPPKRTEEEYRSIYTPFGQKENFRAALFQDRDNNQGCQKNEDTVPLNGDSLPYFQRLRVGSKLNNEVTIHHVTESKLFKGQEPPPQQVQQPGAVEITLLPQIKTEDPLVFARPYPAKTWTPGFVTPSPSNSTSSINSNLEHQYGFRNKSSGASSVYDSVSNSSSNSPQANVDQHRADDIEGSSGFGPIGPSVIGGQRINGMRREPNSFYPETSVFAPDRSITNLSELESSERDIETFKRFDFYFEPPKNKPKINLNVHDIAAQLKPKDK